MGLAAPVLDRLRFVEDHRVELAPLEDRTVARDERVARDDDVAQGSCGDASSSMKG